MGEAPTNPPTPLSLTLWLIRHSPAVSEAAMVLFVVLSGLSLAVATANHGALSIWYRVGIAGIVLTLGSLVYLPWPVTNRGGEWKAGRQLGVRITLIALAVLIAAFAEFVLVVLVGRSATTAIAVLGVAQPVLVGAVALVSSAFPELRPEHFPARRRRSWFGLLGLVGMVITCGAFAAWMVNTLVVQGRWWNVGPKWPGLLIAMAVLTVTAVVCAPGVIWRADGNT